MSHDLIPLARQHGPGYHYVLLNADTGDATCTCPGFERWGHCWAIKAAREIAMTRDVVVAVPQTPSILPTPDELRSMDILAAQMIESETVAVPANLRTKADVRAVIFAGWEAGVQPMTALRHIGVVNGKTEPDAQLMVGIILTKEPDCRFEVTKETATETTVRYTRPSKGYTKEFTYTDQMAKDAGLLGKNNAWATHKNVMRQWAAIKRLARVYAADLINGIRSPITGELPEPAGIALPPEDPDAFDGEYSVQDLDPPAEAVPAEPGTGVIEQVPLATDEQLATVRDYSEAIHERHGAAGLTAVLTTAGERWPYAVEGGLLQPAQLTLDDANAFISLLKATLEGAPGQML